MKEELVEKEGVEGDDEKIKVHNMKTSPVNFHFKLQVIFDCREGKCRVEKTNLRLIL